ncbi:uncharacterized protein LOC128249596 [Octopus bimaculoides]|uniref:uncharacterized protein LOC128249596 n=1 Tax=Octopus bimaculoides TaxID=37653 RepID=UPI0022E83E6F|nr:uncharacterized protein LOC128249596 [Octopus bimaculoides]
MTVTTVNTWNESRKTFASTPRKKSLISLPIISERNVVTDMVKESGTKQCCPETKSKTTKRYRFTKDDPDDSEACQRIIMEVMKERLVTSKISALKGRLQMLTLMVNDCEEYLRQKEQLRLRQKQRKTIFQIILVTVVISMILFIPFLYSQL